jgi:hypothetical protein
MNTIHPMLIVLYANHKGGIDVATPYVGILVNAKTYEGVATGNTHYEQIAFYEDAGEIYGLKPCYFRIEDLNLEQQMVIAYVKNSQHYTQQILPLPQIVHNRAIHLKHEHYIALDKWRTSGIIVFNHWNRYNKWYIHQILMREPTLLPHLPMTCVANSGNMAQMKQKFTSLIIKPNKSSIGRGIMKLDHLKTGQWRLTYPRKVSASNRIWKKVVFSKKCPVILTRRIESSPYIVQQRIPLATFEGKPFDFRVSVQRGASGDWELTGIVGKVAAKRHFLTNIGQGGQVLSVDQILSTFPSMNKEKVLSELETCAMKIVNTLSKHLPHLADVGLDIGIHADGFPMFIECNGKDQRYSFMLAGQMEAWKNTYFKPIAYARYLLDHPYRV